MTLKKLIRLEFNSGFLRGILTYFYNDGKCYPFLLGALRGLKSCYRPDINFHVMLGLWERDSLAVLLKLFKQFGLSKKKMVVADIGANVGYYSLFFSKYLGSESSIFAFEPSNTVLDVLKKNLAVNNIRNVTVVEKACVDQSAEVIFYIGKHHHKSSVIREWAGKELSEIVVQGTSIDDYFYNRAPKLLPDLIKIDIEGGGVLTLPGCDKCIAEKRPFIIIESHTPEEDIAISNVLVKHNYEAYRINTRKWVQKKNMNYRDSEGVWGTMLLIPGELRNKFII